METVRQMEVNMAEVGMAEPGVAELGASAPTAEMLVAVIAAVLPAGCGHPPASSPCSCTQQKETVAAADVAAAAKTPARARSVVVDRRGSRYSNLAMRRDAAVAAEAAALTAEVEAPAGAALAVATLHPSSAATCASAGTSLRFVVAASRVWHGGIERRSRGTWQLVRREAPARPAMCSPARRRARRLASLALGLLAACAAGRRSGT